MALSVGEPFAILEMLEPAEFEASIPKAIRITPAIRRASEMGLFMGVVVGRNPAIGRSAGIWYPFRVLSSDVGIQGPIQSRGRQRPAATIELKRGELPRVLTL
jgi:hypothetical protein